MWEEAAPRRGPGASLPSAPATVVPAQSLQSHPRRVPAAKNTPGHFQIWNVAPWSP